jgi:hypothetical protein
MMAPLTDYELLLPQFALLIGRMTVKGSRRGELAQLMPNHVLRYEDRDEFLAVVNGERQPDKIGSYG